MAFGYFRRVSDDAPFTRDAFVVEPAFVGARWWQESLRSPIDRRAALKAILVVGGALAGLALVMKVGGILSKLPPDLDSDSFDDARRRALEMQKEFGWSFGATESPLTFDGAAPQAFDRNALDHLAADLEPTESRLVPYYVRTLFEAPSALPTSRATDGTPAPASLKDALVPMHTPSMVAAYRAGRALAELLSGARVPTSTMIVDLPGEDAVAFAAGAARTFEPVFLFDNWPHPFGVVPAHRTLAAAAYYQPLFVRQREVRPKDAPALFVLDRNRLAPYIDSPSLFDNRYVARLPTADKLRGLGVRRIFYLVPTASDVPEMDDVNDVLGVANDTNLPVRFVPTSSFSPLASPDGQADDDVRFGYMGSNDGVALFGHDYFDLPAPAAPAPAINALAQYRPAPRLSPFTAATNPPDFATVPVVVAVGTGVVVGAAMRSGSWNRSPYSSSGGG